jgi:hypothetical protein
VIADGLLTATGLVARRTGVFALPRSMTLFLAKVDSTFELLAACISASNFSKPTRLILQRMLPANTAFLNQEWTLRTRLLIFVTLMLDLRMTTSTCTGAIERAWWRAGSTWLRGLKDCPTTGAADFLKYCFQTASAWSFVAEIGACVVAAFQWTATCSETDMFGFEVLLGRSWARGNGTVLPFRRLSFTGFLLSRATAIPTFVSATVES